ncbi:MAG TPA: aldose 1-epimerase [Caulobacteraceae bacterium]
MTDLLALRSGDLELDLAPAVGGSVAGFRLRRGDRAEPLFRESRLPYSDVLQSASYPLVPFSNRVRDGRFTFRGREVRLSPNLQPQPHPLHGQGWRGAWSVASAGEASAELRFRHEPDEWPWAYEAVQRFGLDADGLTLVLSATNTSDEEMPCGLGLHPYFPSNPETVLEVETKDVWTIDEEVMPVERQDPVGRYDLRRRRIDAADLDNGYEGWGGQATITWPDRSLTLRFSSPDATRFQVYSPPEGGVFVAEPVTNRNDVFAYPEEQWPELGVRILAPGETTSLTTRFEVVTR